MDVWQPVEKVGFREFGCHCWLVQQCFSGSFSHALLGKPAVAPFFNGLLAVASTRPFPGVGAGAKHNG